MEQYSITDTNAVRDTLYLTLVSENPHLFPPQPEPIAVSDVFQYLHSSAQLQVISLFCESDFEPNYIPTFFLTALNNSSWVQYAPMINFCPSATNATIQE